MEDDDLRNWAKTLGVEEQVSILATLIHANNNKVLTEDLIMFAMALGARGMVNLQSRHDSEIKLNALKDRMGEGLWWRR